MTEINRETDLQEEDGYVDAPGISSGPMTDDEEYNVEGPMGDNGNPDYPDDVSNEDKKESNKPRILIGPSVEIRNLLNGVDFKKYTYKSGPRKGEFTNDFYKNVRGRFHFKNDTRTKKGFVTFIMDTPESEIIAGILLNGQQRKFKVTMQKIGTFANILNYVHLPFLPNIKRVYLDEVKYIKEDNEIKNIIDKVDFSYYVYKSGPKESSFKPSFYKFVKGGFSVTNDGKVNLNMKTAMDELVVGLLLENDEYAEYDIDYQKIGSFKKILKYDDDEKIFSLIKDEYLKNIRFLTAHGTKKRFIRPKYVRNVKTGHIIKTDSRSYKQIYHQIKLKRVIYKDLSKYLTIDYHVSKSCIIDYFQTYVDKDIEQKLKRILGYQIENIKAGFDTDEIFKVAKFYNFSCTARMVYNATIIGKFVHDETKPHMKELNYIIHKEHMYVLQKQQFDGSRKDIVITNINDIYRSDRYKNLIVTDLELFRQISEYIKEKYEAIDYSPDTIHYKTHIIKWIPDYIEDNKILIEEKSKNSNVYTYIDRILKLRGYLNSESMDSFVDCNKIRLDGSGNTNLRCDQNKSYIHQLVKNNIMFPVPSINDFWKPYDGHIIDYGIYDCILNEYDNILAPYDGKYTGYEIKILKKEKRIKEIRAQFIASQFRLIDKQEVLRFPTDIVRRYIGWLQHQSHVESSNYSNIYGDEETALLRFLGDEAHLSNEKGIIRVCKHFMVKKTGLLTNIMVKALANIDLYYFNKSFLEINPHALLVTIKTDSIGYIFSDDAMHYVKPKKLITKDKYAKDKSKYMGFFKIEHENMDESYDENNYQFKEHQPEIQITIKEFLEINHYSSKDITKLVEDRKSFQIWGKPGFGKSTSCKEIIRPLLEKMGKKYVICSSTKESANLINGETVQGLFSSKSLYEIQKYFEDVTYVIIDESSQIRQDIYKMLEYIRDNTECKFILMGDHYQCPSIDSIRGETWIIGEFVTELAGNNIVTLEEHAKIRYTPELNKILNHITDHFDDKLYILEYIIKKFKTAKTTNTRLNIAFTHAVCDKIRDKKINRECQTVHSIQGKTLDEDYSIFEITRMEPHLIYTALSRAKDVKQIIIITGNIGKLKVPAN